MIGVLLSGLLLSGRPLNAAEIHVPMPNGVLTLDGESDCLHVPDTPSLHSFAGAITIEAWVKAASFTPDNGMINCVIRKDVAKGDEDFFLQFRTIDGRPCLEMSPGVEVGQVRAEYDFQPGRWYHLAATYDGSRIVAYVNATEIGGQIALGKMAIDKADLFIGKGDPEHGGEYFHGTLDEIRLWNVAQSGMDIRQNMGGRLSGQEDGLVAYWNFDDGTANDRTANGNNALFPLVEESVWPDPQAAATPIARPNAGTVHAQAGGRERARDRVVRTEEATAMEEFRGTKAEILAGEPYKDSSTPLRAALTQFFRWEPGEMKDTYLIVYSKGQWIWAGAKDSVFR